jgi:Tol biopolymer transport system component
VFASNRGDASYQLYTATTDGRNLKPLRPNFSTSRSPRWSPDGTTIAFISTEPGRNRICTIRRDGTGFRSYNKTNPDLGSTGEACLDWSPDGDRLVFVADDHTTLRVLTLTDDSEGTKLISGSLGKGADHYNGVSWSSGGILLNAQASRNGEQQEIFRVDPKAGKATQLTDLWNERDYYLSPVASPDGKHIAAVRVQHVGKTVRRSLFEFDSTGASAKLLLKKASDRVSQGNPRWFPRGDRIIFTLGSQEHEQLYSADRNGTNEHRLSSGDWDDVEPDVWTLK